jgi:Sortase domain
VSVYRSKPAQRRLHAALFVWLLALAGLGTLAAAFIVAPLDPPRPSLADAPDGYHYSAGHLLMRSTPIAVDIPAIGVSAPIIPTGVAANRSIEVPPLDQPSVAGWYRYGPSPGEAGSAVIVGHVDSSTSGRAVFFDLGRLHKGDRISILRDDGATAGFAVTGVSLVAKDAFPATEVHKTSSAALLRLITCGGSFDREARSYLDNLIVYAVAV